MESGHAFGQLLAIALEADIDLIAADVQERGIDDFTQQANPPFGLEIPIQGDLCP